jgi:hypothetical protein
VTILRTLSTTLIAGALTAGALGFPASASAEAPLAPGMLNTTCSLDQIMAATRASDPVAYGNLVGRFNSQPRWIQGGIIYHMNLLLQTPPSQRQGEANQLAGRFPEFVGLFTVDEPQANEIAAKCPTFPAVDPAIWNPAAPAPAPVAVPEPATASAAPVAPVAPVAPAAPAVPAVPPAPAAPAATAAPAA